MDDRPTADGTGPPAGARWQCGIGDPGMSERLASADVVIGVDAHDRDCRAIFFGRSALGRAVEAGRVSRLDVLRVVIDFAGDDPETLEAACVAARGSSSYQVGTTDRVHPDCLPPGEGATDTAGEFR